MHMRDRTYWKNDSFGAELAGLIDSMVSVNAVDYGNVRGVLTYVGSDYIAVQRDNAEAQREYLIPTRHITVIHKETTR
jgi:ribosomal 30S subunit maturation factor RimM